MHSAYLPMSPQQENFQPYEDRRSLDTIDVINSATSYYLSCPTIVTNLFSKAWKVINKCAVKPLSHGIEKFFEGPERTTHYKKPVTDIILWMVNPIAALAHLVLPMNAEAECGLPVVPFYATVKNFGQLLLDLFNHELPIIRRILNPFASLTGLTFGTAGIFLALEGCMVFFLKEEFTFNPLEIIDDVRSSTFDVTQKSLLCVTTYILWFNFSIYGRDLILFRLQDRYRHFWANVQMDFFEDHLRYIDSLNEDPLTRQTLTSIKEHDTHYQEAKMAGKNWTGLGVFSEIVKTVTGLPADFLDLSRLNMTRFPLIEGPLEGFGLLPRNRRKYYESKRKSVPKPAATTNIFLATLATFFSCTPIPYIQKYVVKSHIPVPPDYSMMLSNLVVYDYSNQFFPLLYESLKGFIKNDSRSPEAARLHKALETQFLKAFGNYLEGFSLGEPVMPSERYRPAAYFNPSFFKKAHEDKKLVDFLEGRFYCDYERPDPSFTRKAEFFNSILYDTLCEPRPEDAGTSITPESKDRPLPRSSSGSNPTMFRTYLKVEPLRSAVSTPRHSPQMEVRGVSITTEIADQLFLTHTNRQLTGTTPKASNAESPIPRPLSGPRLSNRNSGDDKKGKTTPDDTVNEDPTQIHITPKHTRFRSKSAD